MTTISGIDTDNASESSRIGVTEAAEKVSS